MSIKYGQLGNTSLVTLPQNNNSNSSYGSRYQSFPRAIDTSQIRTTRAEESGDIGDFLWSAVGGALESFSFGIIEGEDVTGVKWEDMNMAERMGYGLGNVGALVAPYGPFSLLGKGASRVASRYAKQGTKRLTRQIARDISKKYGSKAGSRRYIQAEIEKQLLKNKQNRLWLERHTLNQTERIAANKTLQNNLKVGLQKSFKDAGIKQLDDKIANEIAEQVASGLRGSGRHVNTIEGWLESYIGRKFPRLAGGGTARYMGMIAQDFYLFQSHRLIMDTVSAAKGEEVNLGWGENGLLSASAHNLLLGSVFPGIRAIPGGGKHTLMQGLGLYKSGKALKKNFLTSLGGGKSANYKEMIKTKEGQKGTRGLLGMLTRGSDTNVQNVSRFQGKNWQVKGQGGKIIEYSPEQILRDLDSMPISHVVQILEQYQLYAKSSLKNWAKGWAKEQFHPGQVMRVAAGAYVMNFDLFKNNYYQNMRTPELWQHLVVGGLMTKGRGLWGRSDVNQWSRDYSHYNEMFNYLNMDVGELNRMVGVFTNNRDLGHMHNLTTRQTVAGNDIYNIIDPSNTKKNSQAHGMRDNYDSAKAEIGSSEMTKVEEAVKLANMMRIGEVSNPRDAEWIDIKSLSKDRILEIYQGLQNVKVGKNKLLDVPFADFMAMNAIEIGHSNHKMYLKFIEDFSKKASLPIQVEVINGEYTGKIIYTKPGGLGNIDTGIGAKYEHSLNRFYGLLQLLEDAGLAESYTDSGALRFEVKGDKLVRVGDKTELDIAKLLEETSEAWMSKIVRSVHGDDNATRFNFLGLDDALGGNSYLGSILAGRAMEMKDRAYELANGRGTDPNVNPVLAEGEAQFLALVNKLFRVDKDKTKNFGIAKQYSGLILKRAPKVTLTEEEKKNSKDLPEKEAAVNDLQQQINESFEWIKAGNAKNVAPDDVRNEITMEEAKELLRAQEKIGLKFPSEGFYKYGFKTSLADYVARRTLEGMKFTEEDLAMVWEAKENGLFDMGDKRMLSLDAMEKKLKLDGLEGEELARTLKRYSYILRKFTRAPEIQTVKAIPTDGTLYMANKKGIDSVYEVSKKGASHKIHRELKEVLKVLETSGKPEQLEQLGIEINEIVQEFAEIGLSGAVPGGPGGLEGFTAQEITAKAVETLYLRVEEVLNKIQTTIGGNPQFKGMRQKIMLDLENMVDMYNKGQISTQNVLDSQMSIGASIQELAGVERSSQLRVNEIMTKLMSLYNTTTGKGRMLMMKENLMSELMKHTGDNTSVSNLEDAIQEYVKHRSLDELYEVLYKTQQITATAKHLREYKADQKELQGAIEELLVQRAAHAKNSTPIKVMKRYNLQDPENPNTIDEEFISLVKKGGLKLTDGDIKDYIIRNWDSDAKNRALSGGGVDVTPGQRLQIEQAIRKSQIDEIVLFAESALHRKHGELAPIERSRVVQEDMGKFIAEFPVLLRNIATKLDLTTSYTIKDNMIEVNHSNISKPTIGGLSSDFMQTLDLEFVGALSDAIIYNGRKTTLNLAKLTKTQMMDLLVQNDHANPEILAKIAKAKSDDEVRTLISENAEKTNTVTEYAILDMNAGNPIVVPLTTHNRRQITDGFKIWRDATLETMTDARARANFEKSTERLNADDSGLNIEVKMLLMNMHHINAEGFQKMFTPEHFSAENLTARNQLYTKLLKVSTQAINENYSYVDDHYLGLLRDFEGVDPVLRRVADKFLTNGVKIQVISDEAFKRTKDQTVKDGFRSRDAVNKHHQDILDDPNSTAFEKETARQSIEENNNLESLNTSMLDGGVLIIDPDIAYLMGSMHGDVNGNGFKNNIANSGGILGPEAKGVISKGYWQHNPRITANNNIDLGETTIVMGESAAKSFYGKMESGAVRPGKLEPYKFTPEQAELSLMQKLETIPSNTKEGVITVPFKSIGIGHMAEPKDGVFFTQSLNDNMGKGTILKNRIWTELSSRIEQLSKRKTNWEKFEAHEQALAFFRAAVDETGYDFTDGGYSMAEGLLRSGLVSHHNPIIRQATLSLFRGHIFDVIRRHNIKTGADTYLIADIENTHRPTAFRNIYTNNPELYRRNDGADVPQHRVVVKFGDTSMPHHMGKQRIERIEDIDFVIDYEGRDIRFRVREDGKIDITDALYDVMAAKKDLKAERWFLKGDDKDNKLTDISENKHYAAFMETVGSIFKNILTDASVDKSQLTNEGILSIISTGKYMTVDRNTGARVLESLETAYIKELKRTNKASKIKETVEFIKKLKTDMKKTKLGLGMSTLAIPKKSFDVGFNRVKEFLPKEFGNHSILNNHDLRVMHQRDWDGDHGYHYYGMPSENVDWHIRRMGTIRDYSPFPETPFESNPLGIVNGIVGASPDEVGFTHLKNQIRSNQFAIGETIALKQVVNWANNMGFEFNFSRSGRGVKDLRTAQDDTSFRNFSDIDGIKDWSESENAGVARQIANINQNAVDFWSPSEIAQHIYRAYMYGDLPPEVANNLAAQGYTFDGVMSNNKPFRFHSGDADLSSPQSKSSSAHSESQIRLNQDISDIVVRTLRKASQIFTDPYNEGGQYTPTDWHLKTVFGNMRALVENPNSYIVNNLIFKYKGDKPMIKQILDMFYNDDATNNIDFFKDSKKINDFLKPIWKGARVPDPVNSIITIKNGITKRVGTGYKNWKDLLAYDDAGFALTKLQEKKLLVDRDYWGEIADKEWKAANGNQTVSKILLRAENLVSRINVFKAYVGEEPVLNMDDSTSETYFELELLDKRQKKKTADFRNVEIRSAVYHVLLKEANGLRFAIAKESGSPFKVNTFEFDNLQSRLGDVESALKVLDKKSMQGLVNKDLWIGSKVFNSKYKNHGVFTNNSGRTIHLYRIKNTKGNRTGFSREDLVQQDFRDLKYLGPVNRDKTYDVTRGYTYIEVKTPIVRRFVGDNESTHALGLWHAIEDTKMFHKIYQTRLDGELFWDKVYNLHQTINSDYAYTREVMKKDPAYKDLAYEEAALIDRAEIEKFFIEYKAIQRNQHGEIVDTKFDKGEVGLELVKALFKPQPVGGSYVQVEGMQLPYLSMNTRLQSSVIKYLQEIEVIAKDGTFPSGLDDIFALQRNNVKVYRGYKGADEHNDLIVQSHKNASGITQKPFESLSEEHGNLVKSIMWDLGWIDPAVENIIRNDLADGPIYEKRDANNKKQRFKKIDKKRVDLDGCN